MMIAKMKIYFFIFTIKKSALKKECWT